jgi:hypothetical protein
MNNETAREIVDILLSITEDRWRKESGVTHFGQMTLKAHWERVIKLRDKLEARPDDDEDDNANAGPEPKLKPPKGHGDYCALSINEQHGCTCGAAPEFPDWLDFSRVREAALDAYEDVSNEFDSAKEANKAEMYAAVREVLMQMPARHRTHNDAKSLQEAITRAERAEAAMAEAIATVRSTSLLIGGVEVMALGTLANDMEKRYVHAKK